MAVILVPSWSAELDADQSWMVARAKTHLSEVIDRARTQPQHITRNGKHAVVVVSAAEWERKTERRGTLADFLLQSPLRGVDLDVTRSEDRPRDVEL